ncbi:MAG: Crp/Fnr family transcriptional regulator [Actinobacteria bacterium]|nr:Crp/Fnr family transcriptional regulator [Actinomycetota bacterium]
MDPRECPVIAALPERDRHRLLDRAVPRSLERDETLHLAGERPDRIHVVTAGVLKLVAREGGGNETILGLAAPGDIVGELGTIDGLDQPLDVIAATKVDVVGIDAETFIEAVTASPTATRCLFELQAARLRWIYSSALERSASEVPARLAGRLLDLADMIGRVEDGAVALDMPLQQTDLGRLAGVCRESACKTLRRFKSEGFVDYRGRQLRILRPDALERIRCAGRA